MPIGLEVALDRALTECTLAVFLTEFSATAPLDGHCKKKEDFRAASLPGLERRMEKSALAADYREVARRCNILGKLFQGAESLEVCFSTGHECKFDLRFRKAEVDDGFLPRLKEGDRIINLPSGEAFIVPYEGEKPGEASRTAGELPVEINGELLILQVEGNKIERVQGKGREAERLREYFAVDPAAQISPKLLSAVMKARWLPAVLEDEKAGFHWAYGRLDRPGRPVGVQSFIKPENVVHQDTVYAKGNPIQVAEAAIISKTGRRPVIRDGAYLVF